jgi:hypothetical protein
VRNYEKGLRYGQVFAAINRHLWSWWRGQDNDQEDGQHHLAAAAWGCLTLLEFEKRGTYVSFDDRPFKDLEGED